MNLLKYLIHHKGKIYGKLSKEIFDCLQILYSWLKEFSSKCQIQQDFNNLLNIILNCILNCLDPNTNSTIDVLNGCTGFMLTLFYNFSNYPLTEFSQYKIILQNLPQLTQFLVSKFQFNEFEPIIKRKVHHYQTQFYLNNNNNQIIVIILL